MARLRVRLRYNLHALDDDLSSTTMTRITVFLVLCLSIFTQNALASVLAIDYGSDWIKASFMSPGLPFDVLLDRSSKRKIQSTVGWKREDRLFGSDAFNIVGALPSVCMSA